MNDLNGVPKQDIINVLKYVIGIAESGRQVMSPSEAGAVLQNLAIARQLVETLEREDVGDTIPIDEVILPEENDDA